MDKENKEISKIKRMSGVRYGFSGMFCLLVVAGECEVAVNIRQYSLTRGDFIMLPEEYSVIWYSFSHDFEAEIALVPHDIYIDVSCMMPTTYYWKKVAKYPIFHMDEKLFDIVQSWFCVWGYINDSDDAYVAQELTSHFHTLFLCMEGYLKRNFDAGYTTRFASGPRKIINDFYSLLTVYAKENKNVAFYAGRLNITPSYLNKICSRNGLSSPKRIIDLQRIVEIKTLLLTTRKPIKMISAELKFEDESYMCRFFRRYTGKSPAAFRETQH